MFRINSSIIAKMMSLNIYNMGMSRDIPKYIRYIHININKDIIRKDHNSSNGFDMHLKFSGST